jgi:hypothetical protein
MIMHADVPGSLYFELEGVRHESGSTILITEVGTSLSSFSILIPGAALVCVTSAVNTECCRERDHGNVGEWLFPNGSIVPRNRNSQNSGFSRTGYTQQIRLNNKNNVLEPTGTYTCIVPREDGCGDEVHEANITLGQ